MTTDILVRPLITEKMTRVSEKLAHYGFIVEKNANKIEIKKAIEAMYNVHVTDVRTMIIPAKATMRYTKKGLVRGRKAAFKKAIVTLAEGETIDFYSEI
jgi:large subunit ribosomal protein L23